MPRRSDDVAVIPARIARTGILVYRNPDGTQRRELRLPEEVFHPDSLATLEGVPVIDIADHTALVTSKTYELVVKGHAQKAKRDGNYVASDLHIEDVATFDAIDLGERADVSAGYAARLDFTPGTYEGEAYDCVQREIRFNHVALCPPGRGRSGPEVGVRLDQLRAEPTFSALAYRVDALFGARSRGDVVRYDAPIPLKYLVPPKDGVTCACKVRRNDQGRLERTDECSCSRDGGVVDHEHGPRRVSGVAARIDANPFEAAALAAAKLRMVRGDAFTEITRAAANLRRR